MTSSNSTQLESLSNEIVLDILEYLDAYQMCYAFSNLNTRLNSLLRLARLYISYNLSTVCQTIWDTVISLPQFSQSRVLSISNASKIDERILIDLMKTLRTISCHSINLKSINEICHHISPENQIKCLSILEKTAELYDGTIPSLAHLLLIDHSHRFLSLTHLSLIIPWYRKFPVISTIFPQLRYLSLTNFYFSIDLLHFLHANTPNLRSLKFLGIFHPITWSSILINHLHELHINHQNKSSHLEGILSNFPSLRRLHIEWKYHERYMMFNGSLCQQLIERYCLDIKQLTIDFDSGVDPTILSTFHQGDFWSKKQMKVKTSLNPTQSKFRLIKSISFGQEWHFSYFDNLYSA